MPRPMPKLARGFELKVAQALELANKIEVARSRLTGPGDRSLLHPERIELVYEMAFFRFYLAWEEFLEETFIRYMAGYVSPQYSPVSRTGFLYPNLAAALSAMLGGRTYKLWHDPSIVVARSAGFLDRAPHELVIGSALTDLERYSRVRHRIAHAQDNAKVEFDAACIALLGHKVKGSKAGKLLRTPYVDPAGAAANPGHLWLHEIASTYVSLANQIG
jgi:hypothetical protein